MRLSPHLPKHLLAPFAATPLLLLAACQQEESVPPEPANTDVSGGELIVVPADSANPQGVTLPEATMTPVPAESATPAAE